MPRKSRTCSSFRRVYSPSLGRYVKRCKTFSGARKTKRAARPGKTRTRRRRRRR